MANLSTRTRKEQVLDYLIEHTGTWIDGPEVANERVGGSEGHRRLRELRAEGWNIQERRHPDPSRDIWQYRIPDRIQDQRPTMVPDRKGLVRMEREGKPDQYISPRRATAESYDNARKQTSIDQRKLMLTTPRIQPGQLRVQWGDTICPSCSGTGGSQAQACFRCDGKGIV